MKVMRGNFASSCASSACDGQARMRAGKSSRALHEGEGMAL